MLCCCIGNYKDKTNQSTRKQLEFTKRLTPPSPLVEGQGGETLSLDSQDISLPYPLVEGQGVRPIVGEWLRLYLLLHYIFEGEGCCSFAHNLVFGRYLYTVFQVDYHLIISRFFGNVETTGSIGRISIRGVEGCAGQSQ